MNSRQRTALSALAFAMLGTAGAVHAETYEGVHSITSYASRADVRADAVAAAHNDNPYADGADSGPASGTAPVVASTLDRATVRAAARAAARGDALPL
jgi:hypothetical protein